LPLPATWSTTSSASAPLHRRSAALRAPTNPADEPAFLAEFDSIEREAAEVDAAMRRLLA
jgi:hypothetical protein